jgi:hypothetical protein
METAKPLLEYSMQKSLCSTAGGPNTFTYYQLQKYTLAVAWLCQQLQDMQQHPTEAAAAGVPLELLQELLELADKLLPKVNSLGSLCCVASGAGAGPVSLAPVQGHAAAAADSAAAATVFQAHLQACAEGWLPQGLQQLGAKVWAAWPQKYACNDDRCLNLSGLTEQSCAKQKCTDCKVRADAVYCTCRA